MRNMRIQGKFGKFLFGCDVAYVLLGIGILAKAVVTDSFFGTLFGLLITAVGIMWVLEALEEQ